MKVCVEIELNSIIPLPFCSLCSWNPGHFVPNRIWWTDVCGCTRISSWQRSIECHHLQRLEKLKEYIYELLNPLKGFATRNDKNFSSVKVNLAIRSMGPVEDNLEQFTFDCYFRQVSYQRHQCHQHHWHQHDHNDHLQTWTDPRLQFNTSHLEELPMDWKFLSKVIGRNLYYWLLMR